MKSFFFLQSHCFLCRFSCFLFRLQSIATPHFFFLELTPEQIEENRKHEERKDRLHQNYLKRKTNGKQKEYEEKVKVRRKEEIEAKKEAIRAEDIAKGVFIPVSMTARPEPQIAPRQT